MPACSKQPRPGICFSPRKVLVFMNSCYIPFMHSILQFCFFIILSSGVLAQSQPQLLKRKLDSAFANFSPKEPGGSILIREKGKNHLSEIFWTGRPWYPQKIQSPYSFQYRFHFEDLCGLWYPYFTGAGQTFPGRSPGQIFP